MTVDEIKEMIQKWLIDEGFKVSSVDDDSAFFNFLVEDKRGRTVNVYQNTKRKDRITVATRASLDEEQKEGLIGLGGENMTRLFWTLRLGLLNRDVGFDSMNELLREGVKLSTNVYYDGLSKDSFMNRMFEVRKALLYVGWLLDREMGKIEPTSEPSFHFIA